MRTMEELQAVVDHDPFEDEADDPKRYFVVFLHGKPGSAASTSEDWSPDSFAATGTELYAWCPDGHAGQPADEGAGQAGPRRHRDRPQHEHGQEAAGREQPVRLDAEPVQQPAALGILERGAHEVVEPEHARVAREPRVQRRVQAARARAR